MKNTLILALLFACQLVHAQQVELVKPRWEDFVPANWKTILQEQGDLNKDGVADLAVIVENTDPDNIKQNNGLGVDTLNLNPRMLMVFFRMKNGYQLVSKNDNHFIPAPNDEVSPCLADPLLEDGGISIQKGVLKISFHYWLSCGSWYVNDAAYTFRYQNKAFELIGFDHREYHRTSGDNASTSINYSTGKKSETTGTNLFEDDSEKPNTTWTTFKKSALMRLEECDAETYFSVMNIIR